MYVSQGPTQGLKSLEDTGVIMVHPKKDLFRIGEKDEVLRIYNIFVICRYLHMFTAFIGG